MDSAVAWIVATGAWSFLAVIERRVVGLYAAGVVAPRCNFATVTVNGQLIGLYVHVESIKKQFVGRHFADVCFVRLTEISRESVRDRALLAHPGERTRGV